MPREVRVWVTRDVYIFIASGQQNSAGQGSRGEQWGFGSDKPRR
jgi:hypothetical protein